MGFDLCRCDEPMIRCDGRGCHCEVCGGADNYQNQERIARLRELQQRVKFGDIVDASGVKLTGLYVIAIEPSEAGPLYDTIYCANRDTRPVGLPRRRIDRIVASGFDEVAEGYARELRRQSD